MTKKVADSRTRLLRAATRVTHQLGYPSAALADIAKAASVPLGNLYYYFKTKEELGEAIIGLRISRFRKLLREIDKLDAPQERLCAFVQIEIKNRVALARHGCPVGTLCGELRKHGSRVAKRSTILFAECLAWMEAQFRALGKGGASRPLAVHLLAATQGVSVLAHTFEDPALIEMEAARLKDWIRSL